ncbi:WD40-repeat-containing domain protein [Polychytrium aggregatum]|uniref:WD40-repeat-containing domain protein n=1 Tax=Polychytrium aggregatum TaxID=110093 RepID=UPI0022FF03C9|nr:WD40-repeat-containing domain protein [Polychytrium aggregatum]KAI9205088.1 WD40-repeat-containing domain protein [Polychytrium aggregatum]
MAPRNPKRQAADDEFIDANDIEQVIELGNEEAEPMSEDEEAVDHDEMDNDMLNDDDAEHYDDDADFDDEDGQEGDEMEGGDFVLVDDSIQGFFDHKEPVYTVALHPTQEHIVATGGGDDKSYLWRLDNGEKMFDLGVHSDTVAAVAFSFDGAFIASGGMDGKVFVFKVSTGELVVTLDGPTEVSWLDWHPRGPVLLAGSADGTIWMWQIPSGTCMNVFSGHVDMVSCGQFTPDGKAIVSGSDDGSVIIWDPKTAAAQLKLTSEDARFHSDAITTLAINKDNNLALTGSADSTAKLIHIGNGKIVASFESHQDSVQAVGFSNVLPFAATGSIDGSMAIWDVTTTKLRQTVKHDDVITSLKWHSDQPLITTASVDRTIRVWDARTGNCERVFNGHQDVIHAIAISKDGKTVVSASEDGTSLVFSA